MEIKGETDEKVIMLNGNLAFKEERGLGHNCLC